MDARARRATTTAISSTVDARERERARSSARSERAFVVVPIMSSSTVDDTGERTTRERPRRASATRRCARRVDEASAPRRSRVEGERGSRDAVDARREAMTWGRMSAMTRISRRETVDARAATSLVVGAAFFIVNRRVAGAVRLGETAESRAGSERRDFFETLETAALRWMI